MHGAVNKGWLVKRGKQVVKFWKHDGYAVSAVDLHRVKGVILYTQYDGTLYQTSATILAKGTSNLFGDEVQYVLPVKDWMVRDDTKH